MKAIKYILAGLYFGFILIKSEAISWYRIVEMFHFKSFHMFGVIGSAVFVGAISYYLIKKSNLKDAEGHPLRLSEKPKVYKANFIGGIFFGIGWGLAGACSAPLFVLLGSMNYMIAIPIIFAFIGVIVYGFLKPKLPH